MDFKYFREAGQDAHFILGEIGGLWARHDQRVTTIEYLGVLTGSASP